MSVGRRAVWGELLGLAVLAAPLRFVALDRHPLWLDEANSVLVTRGGPGGVIDALSIDGNPPLFYWLLWGWTRLFGESEIAVRALPALLGVLSVLVLHRLAARLFDNRRWLPLLSGVLFALSPLMVYYGRECRMYSLTPLIGMLGAWTLYEATKTGRWRHFALHGLVLAAGLYTHNFFLFLLPAPILAAFLIPGPDRNTTILRAGACVAGAVLLYAPWVPILGDQVASGVGAFIGPIWDATPPHLALARSLEVMSVGGVYPPYLVKELADLHLTIPMGMLWSTLRALGVVLAVGLLGFGFTRLKRERDAAVVCGLYLSVPLLVPWLVSFVLTPVYLVGRYELIGAFAFALLAARGLVELWSRWRPVAAMALLVWLGAASVSLVGMARGEARVLERVTADWLETFVTPADAIVFTDYSRAVPEYYLGVAGSKTARYSFPAEVGRHPGWYDVQNALNNPDIYEAEALDLAASLRECVAAGGRIYVVDYLRSVPGTVGTNVLLYAALERNFGPAFPAWAPVPGHGAYIRVYGLR